MAVVGAGPAGCATAAALAAAGTSVALVDRAAFPRDKTCGDALTSMALKQLAVLGLDPHRVESWTPIRSAAVHPPDGRLVRLELPEDGRTYAAIARRSDLDAALLDLAVGSGAEFLGSRHVATRGFAGHVVITLQDGSSLAVRHVVVATGATALPHADAVMHATRVYLTAQRALPPEVHVWFDEDLLPGYAWLFPIGEHEANVGVAVHTTHHTGRQAVEATRRLLEDERLTTVTGEVAAGPVRSWPIPYGLDVARSRDRTMYVGDTIGLADPMTGEGIGQAIRSGVLAAEAILASGRNATSAASRYRQVLEKTFARDHRASLLGVRALRRPGATRAAVRLMGGGPHLRAFFARWMWEDIPRSAVLRPVVLLRSVRKTGGARLG